MPAGGDARLLELTSVRDGKKNSNKRDFPGTYPDRVLRGRLLCNLMIYWRSLRDSNPCYSLERRVISLKPDRPLQCFWFGPINSLSRERNSLRIGELFDVLYPTASSIVGSSPSSGRLTTDNGSRPLA